MQRCHTYKIAVSKYQGRCEQRSEVFVKIQNFFFFFFGWGSGRVGLGVGVRVDVNEEFKFLGKFTKTIFFFGGGGGWWGSGWM